MNSAQKFNKNAFYFFSWKHFWFSQKLWPIIENIFKWVKGFDPNLRFNNFQKWLRREISIENADRINFIIFKLLVEKSLISRNIVRELNLLPIPSQFFDDTVGRSHFKLSSTYNVFILFNIIRLPPSNPHQHRVQLNVFFRFNCCWFQCNAASQSSMRK